MYSVPQLYDFTSNPICAQKLEPLKEGSRRVSGITGFHQYVCCALTNANSALISGPAFNSLVYEVFWGRQEIKVLLETCSIDRIALFSKKFQISYVVILYLVVHSFETCPTFDYPTQLKLSLFGPSLIQSTFRISNGLENK